MDGFGNRAMRDKWFGLPPRKGDPIIPPSFLSQIEQIKDAVENTYDLLLLHQLHGFNINEDALMITTPLWYIPCPLFDISIPYNCIEEHEIYSLRDETLAFLTKTIMLLRSGNNSLRLEPGSMLSITKGNNEIDIEGDGRHIKLINSNITIIYPTISTDLILPVGTIAINVTTDKIEEKIRRIGNGIVSWEPITIRGRRGAIPINISWLDVKITEKLPYLPPIQQNKTLNVLLLKEFIQLTKLDQACRRIESILWRGIIMIDRTSLHRDEKESNLIITAAQEKMLDVESLREKSALIRNLDAEHLMWTEYSDKWSKLNKVK